MNTLASRYDTVGNSISTLLILWTIINKHMLTTIYAPRSKRYSENSQNQRFISNTEIQSRGAIFES